MPIKNITLALFVFGFLLSCEAPRQNPFDPQAENYHNTESDSVQTIVQVHGLPPVNMAIPAARVFLLNLGRFAETDAIGSATFTHRPTDSLYIAAQADAYFSDTTVFRNLTKANILEMALNARPQISEEELYSVYVNNDDITDFTSIVYNAKITDADGLQDIETSYIHLKSYDFLDTLESKDGSQSLFGTSFYLQQISTGIEPLQVPELQFEVIVKNVNGDSVSQGPYQILRVITAEPRLQNPSGSISGTDSVYFSWQTIQLEYAFTYNIVLYYAQGQEFIYFRHIPSDKTEYYIEGLSAGSYTAYLQIEDNFGNICQSPFTQFSYQP